MDRTGVLQHLEGAQLIRIGDENERTGTFRHVLIQESAHESLLRPERRRLHEEVGETLEQSFAGRLDDIADVLAKHIDEGGEASKALRLYARAGDPASRRSANHEAATLTGALWIWRGSRKPTKARWPAWVPTAPWRLRTRTRR